MAEQRPNETRWGITHFHRRRYPRINITLPVEYRIVAEPAPPRVPAAAARPGPRVFKTQARTLGGGGLLIEVGERLPVGTRMALVLYLPDVTTGAGGVHEIACEARVAWTDIVSEVEPDEYKCGVEFVQIEAADLERIHRFIRAYQITGSAT